MTLEELLDIFAQLPTAAITAPVYVGDFASEILDVVYDHGQVTIEIVEPQEQLED
jgi:hypothetical protein